MRYRWLVYASVVVLLSLHFAACAASASSKLSKARPRLLKVSIYTYALDTGGVLVNARNNRLQAYVRGVRMSENDRNALEKNAGPGYRVYQVAAALTRKQVIDLKRMVENSGLHDFTHSKTDIKERKPYLDECPPTLVLTWSDKKQVLHLPLDGTVKNNIRKSRISCYMAMDAICERLFALEQAYEKPTFVKCVLVKGPEYKAFEEERGRETGG